MNRIDLKVSIVIVAAMMVLISCSGDKKPVKEAPDAEILPEDIVELRDDQIKLANIEFGKVEIHQMGSSMKANGSVTVAPQHQALVCMPLGGFIRQTFFLPGEVVAKGQTLAVIENQEFVDIQFNFLEARNKLAYAKSEFERHSDLYKNEVYSEKNLQQVTVEYKNLLALTKSLEQKLIMIGIDPLKLMEDNISNSVNLVSPIRGYISKVNIHIGENITPTDVLFEIINNEKLFLELTLFEKDADKVQAGQKIRFFINNESEEHDAVITQTGKSVDDDKTLKVFASVASSCKNILPGMYVNTLIELSETQVTALPEEAIVTFDDKHYIFIFEKDKVEAGRSFTEYRMIEVRKGISASGYIEVALPEKFDINTAKVVVKGAYNLLSAKKNAGEMAC
jgi:membrane fusion protein, heavy metal efflux system